MSVGTGSTSTAVDVRIMTRIELALHGAREEDLIEGVIPTHPLDVQDALIHYARKGAIINSTYQL